MQVVAFSAERIANPYPGGSLPWQVYQDVRNAILRVCRVFGPVGPMGECTIDWNVDSPYRRAMVHNFWPLGDDDPMYYVIDDQYNDEQYCYAELYGEDPFTAEWLASITQLLKEYGGWGLGIGNIPHNFLLIFGDRLMVKGRQLARCTTAAEVVEAVRELLKGKEMKQ
jgi:hypothetical protein